ncbi:MAG: oxidoreductase [Rhodobacteraceae bacterium]|nr:oxidoreductase [Paracoccaceae bacterium]
MTEEPASRELVVVARRALTPDIAEFTLADPEGAALDPFEPGAHITVETPAGAMRRYSLVNDGDAPATYVIALKREADSRGGSASMHAEAQEGTRLRVQPPENSFPLVEAPSYLLIAGGIGITPIQAMGRALQARGKPFEMIYCTRDAEGTAYRDEVAALGGKVTIHHDGGDIDAMYDFWDHFEKPTAAHVYCCGPSPLMEEIRAVSGHWPEGRIHFEDFKPVEVVRADDVAFTVRLASTGAVVEVPEDRTILEALRDAGVRTVSSCESGTCGTCRTRLISGTADHRDMVLMDEEKDSHIMICISRSAGGELVLDL